MNDRFLLTALLIEDCAEDRRTYRRFLQQDSFHAYWIVEVETAKDAVSWCQQETPDVILLNLSLPDGDGLECLRQVQACLRHPLPAVIVLTGQGDIDTAIRAMKSGVQDYLVKDKLTPELLQQTIHHALERTQLAQQLEYSRERQQLTTAIALRICQSLQLDEILHTTVTEVRQFLKADRVLICQFHADSNANHSTHKNDSNHFLEKSGTIVAESVLPGWSMALGIKMEDACALVGIEAGIPMTRERSSIQGQRQVMNDIDQLGLPTTQVQWLRQFQVKAMLVVPIEVNNRLWGVLMVHQCSAPRYWKLVNVELLDQLAVHLAIAIQQSLAYQQTLLLFESNPAPMWVYDLHTLVFLAVNQAAVTKYGYSKDEFLSMTIADICPPEDIPSLLADGQKEVQTTDQATDQELDNAGIWQHQLKDGRLIFVEITSHSINFAGYNAKLVMAQDVTARHHAERKLRESEERFRSTFEQAAVGIAHVSLTGQLLRLNQRFCDIVGYSQYELQSRTFQEITHPDDLVADLNQVQNLLAGCLQTYSLEKRYIRQDQSLCWVNLTVSLLRDRAEQPQYFIAVIEDITARKQIEANLQDSEERLRLALTAAEQGLYDVNVQTGEVIVNSTYAKILGYDPAEFYETDARWLARLHPDDREKIQKIYQAYIAGEIPEYKVEFRQRTKSGQWQWTLSLGKIVAWDKEGKALRMLGTHTDITEAKRGEAERKQAEMALQQAYQNLETRVVERTAELHKTNEQLAHANAKLAHATRMKDEFLANMSHELRTPLNAILGMSEGLQDGMLGEINDRQRKAIATIERSGQHLLELINDILDLSKIESGKLDLDIGKVCILDLCNASLSFVRQIALKKQIHLSSCIPTDIGILQADDRRLRQVLINLLNNAVKFTPNGGSVVLTVNREFTNQFDDQFNEQFDNQQHHHPQPHGWILFTVMDTGIGIAQENLPKLFQPFVQIDSSLSRQYTGTGLGLSLVRRIVERHGGDVAVKSELGQGSCFTVRIPAQPLCPLPMLHTHQAETTPVLASPQGNLISLATPSMPSGCDSPGKLPLILLVEDNLANVEAIFTYLQRHNYRVLLATNGLEAVALAKSQPLDLILMDIQMPEMDGLEAIRRIRAEPALFQGPIIALTALVMSGDREKCLNAGANEYLMKPVSLKQLVATVRQFLQQ